MLNATITTGPTVSHSYCCMCGKDLTDAASIEAGIGPICRNRANAALAKTFTPDYEKAIGALVATDKNVFLVSKSFLAETWDKVVEEVLANSADQRATVKRICWMLSYLQGSTMETMKARFALIECVEALGYKATGAMLRGLASTGEAKIVAHGGFLHLVGPRCKAGATALKAIGAWFNAATMLPTTFKDGSVAPKATATWSVPVAKAALFALTVQTYWIGLASVDLPVLVAEAQGQKPASGKTLGEVIALTKPLMLAAPAKPLATVEVRDGFLFVKSPYSAAFVNELKTLPWGDRSWMAPEWRVHLSHETAVRAMVAKYFGA